VSIDVILPCLNERDALPWVLGRMPAGMHPLVVDNGSTDGSVALAEQLGAEVVTAPVRGYGAACSAGLQHSTAEVVVMLDCDASVDPAELPGFVELVLQGEVDLVVGRRVPVGAGAYPWHLRIANRELARRLSRRTGTQIRDCGPVRVARRRLLVDLEVRDQRSGYPAETIVKAAAAGHRIAQLPISYRARTGRSKVTGTPLGIWRAVRDSSAALR
jgi:glycosyltransferase involved in cell wall biosynthesis